MRNGTGFARIGPAWLWATQCVRTCVKGQSHYALLVGEKVYELTGHNEELDRLAGKTVDVAGTMNTDGAIRLTSVQPATESRAGGTAALFGVNKEDSCSDTPIPRTWPKPKSASIRSRVYNPMQEEKSCLLVICCCLNWMKK